jgi:FKBP-type peptidyl-prolyl cis-trans isomerase SlyD
MIISKDKIVSVTYQLRIDHAEGKIIESLDKDSPLTFLYGSGSLLPKFEDHLTGLRVGDKFDFSLTPEDAYGLIDENAVVDVPINAFEMNGKIDYDLVKIGNNIPMQDSNGNKLNGIVKEVSAEAVTMDFNHPLAGNDLYFMGEVTEIREATDEEKYHGHAHYPGSCEGCTSCGGHDGHC